MKAKTFDGGYSFKGFPGQPADELLDLGVPSRVIIPLSQGFGSPLDPRVRVGEEVSAGQIIARNDDNISSPVHATINGKVVSIEKRNYFKREVSMVTIEGNGKEGYQTIPGSSAQWEKLSAQTIEELIYKSGASSLDKQGIPTRFKSSLIPPEEVENLIIHGADSEVYNVSLELLLKGKNLFNFVEGIKILKKIMPRAKVHLALNEDKSSIIERIKKLTISLDNFEIYPVVSKYPQGYDEILIPTLLGQKYPYGYSAANIGIIILNIQAVLKAFSAVTEGKPLIERTLALCGPAFKKPLHLNVRIGTPLEYILKERLRHIPTRVILYSLLSGFELKDLALPVDRTFSQVIATPENREREFLAFLRPRLQSAVDTNCGGEERPCIQCGYCLEVCPVRIIPTLIDRYARLGINETLMRYGIFNCIDCNLCSYVCPCKIPLAKNIKGAKAKLIDTGCDHSLCILPKFDLIGLEEYKGIKVTR